MTVPSQVSAAEMREAFRLNLSPSACWNIARRNFRSLVYILVFLALIIAEIAKGGAIDWQQIAILAGVLGLILALFWFSIYRTLAKTAKALSATGAFFSIDSQGITSQLPNGTRTVVPWSAVTRWREGKLIFTIGDIKSYRTISKGALGEMQSGELRSLLVSQIR